MNWFYWRLAAAYLIDLLFVASLAVVSFLLLLAVVSHVSKMQSDSLRQGLIKWSSTQQQSVTRGWWLP
jgi:hypothetical protein